ncbi:hypothetical protein [Nocardia aurea]|uniref:hypothetical protein n=1 Tax=Nocardia aurea TaxID=2144174 RepID=UPI0033B95558
MAAQPIGRFYELMKEVEIPEPYVLTSKIKIPPPTRAQMKAVRAATTDDEVERAILGEHADEIFALYDGRPNAEYEAFAKEINKHFFGPGVDDVEGGSDGSSG